MDALMKKMIEKVKKYEQTYSPYLYNRVAELECEIFETDEMFTSVPNTDGWVRIKKGGTFGHECGYAWFKSEFIVPDHMAGKQLWICPEISASESLLFINNKPEGLFDWSKDILDSKYRLHNIQLLTRNAVAGERYNIALESYCGHTIHGTMPFENAGKINTFYPTYFTHTFKGIFIAELDSVVERFVYDIKTLLQIYLSLPDSDYKKWDAYNAIQQIYKVVPQMPWEVEDEIWRASLAKASDIMAPVLTSDTPINLAKKNAAYIGLVGHSHLDTAWMWPVKETIRKAARTFSNALNVMDNYPYYTFIQSSVLYLDWMRKYYPDIFEEIKLRTNSKQWEPNGGSWIECDCNIVGGEFLIRQFLRGQRFLREHLGYEADTFWLPDTFGYSAAIPQIMKGCNLKYFLTTKLSWNDTNEFPYDTFVWRGIDGTEVLVHFNLMHCWPDFETVVNAEQQIKHKDVTNMKLVAYGFGDGGGGPSYSMMKMAERTLALDCGPECEQTTVSGFMNRLEKTAKNLPVYDGELYLELHRGTLTQMHEIKRTNRKAEIAIRNMEILNSQLNALYQFPLNEERQHLIDTVLLNQFHDILPGSSIQPVHELALQQNSEVIGKANKHIELMLSKQCSKTDDYITVYNPLSWCTFRQIVIDDGGKAPVGKPYQKYVDLYGQRKLAIGEVSIQPFEAVSIRMKDGYEMQDNSPFIYDGANLTTPFAHIRFNENGYISSLIDRQTGRELVKDQLKPLNQFLCGEDIPLLWDNWDLDYDQELKMEPQNTLISRKVASDGKLQFRIRSAYKIGNSSEIVQDMVFYSDTPRIDFETKINWKEKHSLLKTSFNVNLRSSRSRSEIQFGYIERNTHRNTQIDKARFEFCNHKWTDISETRFGVALLNDCKYGISVLDTDMRLTLHKGGCRPDPSGDMGEHYVLYSLLPHVGGFSAKSVIYPAYELNIQPLQVKGKLERELKSLLCVDADNVIVESVKPAEDGDGVIIRLYEAEGTWSSVTVKLNEVFQKAYETNMLEDVIEELPLAGSKLQLQFKPFEIKTIKVCLYKGTP